MSTANALPVSTTKSNGVYLLEKVDLGYIVAKVHHIVPDPFGVASDVRLVAFLDPVARTLSHIWSTPECPVSIERILNLLDTQTNIVDVPDMMHARSSDKEAHQHYLSIFWMKQRLSEDEFAAHKVLCIEKIIAQDAKADAAAALKVAKQKVEFEAACDALRQELSTHSKSYKRLADDAWHLAYHGCHFEANIIMQYAQERFPAAFDKNAWEWRNIRPICTFSKCTNTCDSNARFGVTQSAPEVFLPFCHNHKICSK
jgi:hypothetical protein